MSLFFAIMAGGGALFGIYKAFDAATETATSVEQNNFPITSNIYVDNDGEVRKRTEDHGTFTTSQFDSYWTVTPQPTVGNAYHIKLTPVSGSSFYSGGDTLSTWHALTSDRQWNFSEQEVGPLNLTQDYTLEISDDGGSTTLDTITITLDFTWDSP